MNIQPVKNIIPTILEWAKKQIPNYDVCWNFDGGSDYWFPFDFHASIDWEKACNEKFVGILDCRPFMGVYDSDEIHDYEILFIDGKMVCLSHKVGDKSDRNYYWFGNNRTEIMFELMRKFPNVQREDVDILTEEVSEKISKSCYMSFVTIDGELFQYNHYPHWGRLTGKGKQLLFKANENDLEFVGEIEKMNCRFPGKNGYLEMENWQRADFHLVDGTVIVTKNMKCGDVEYYMFQKVEV